MSLSLFKGREATLNKAIMETLALNPNLIKNELTKQVKQIAYVQKRMKTLEKFKVAPSSVSRRVEALKNAGWVKESGNRPVPLFKEAVTSEYALTLKGVAAIFLESPSIQDNIVKVLKVNTDYSEALRLIQPFIDILALLEDLFPKLLFHKYCVKTMKKQFSKINLENLSGKEMSTLIRSIFLSTSSVLFDIEANPKELKRYLGRRYGQVRRRCKRNLGRFKPIVPYLENLKREHERQAKELELFIKMIEDAAHI